jgi:hypothetical protein
MKKSLHLLRWAPDVFGGSLYIAEPAPDRLRLPLGEEVRKLWVVSRCMHMAIRSKSDISDGVGEGLSLSPRRELELSVKP